MKIRGLFVTSNYFERHKLDFFGFFSIFKLIILNIICYSTAITLTSLRFNMLILLVERFRLYLKIEHQIEHSIEKNFFGGPILNSITNWPLYNFMTHISLSFTCTEADFDWCILIYFRK